MKKFTCQEIMNHESGCHLVFAGETPMEVASQCGQHVASSTDEAHRPMRELMANPNHTQEDRAKWFKWFQGEWDKKQEEGSVPH
jgi:hypothetical protein